MRRSVLPSVCPKPRSKGSNVTLAWFLVTSSTSMRRGVRKSVADCGIPLLQLIGQWLVSSPGRKVSLPSPGELGYFEYNSTMRFSLISRGSSLRSGSRL